MRLTFSIKGHSFSFPFSRVYLRKGRENGRETGTALKSMKANPFLRLVRA